MVIKNIQRSDENVRKRWFFGSLTITIAVLFVVWVGYLNSSIIVMQPASATQNENTQNEKSMTETFNDGIKNLNEEFKTKFDSIRGQLDENLSALNEGLTKTNDIVIEKTELKFIDPNMEEIPKTPLP